MFSETRLPFMIRDELVSRDLEGRDAPQFFILSNIVGNIFWLSIPYYLMYICIFLTEFRNVYLTLLVLSFARIFNRFPIAEMWLNRLCSIRISMDIVLMI